MNQTMSMFCLSKDSRGYSEKLGHPIESSWYKLLPQHSISFYEYDIIMLLRQIFRCPHATSFIRCERSSPSDKSE